MQLKIRESNEISFQLKVIKLFYKLFIKKYFNVDVYIFNILKIFSNFRECIDIFSLRDYFCRVRGVSYFRSVRNVLVEILKIIVSQKKI